MLLLALVARLPLPLSAGAALQLLGGAMRHDLTAQHLLCVSAVKQQYNSGAGGAMLWRCSLLNASSGTAGSTTWWWLCQFLPRSIHGCCSFSSFP